MSKSKCGSTSGSCNDNGGCVTIDEAIAQVVTNGKQPQKAIELMVPPSNPADLEVGANSANSNRRSPRSRPPRRQPQKRKPRKLPLARALLAEALGTACIVLVGCGSVCSSLSGAYQGIWQVAAVWGIGVTLAICLSADASGAHLNPAVTLAFWIVRPSAHGMNFKRSVLYVAAQLAGAIAAAAVNLLIHGSTIVAFERANGLVRGQEDSVRSAMAFGEYFPNPALSQEFGSGGPFHQDDISIIAACGVEAWGTFILTFIIFAITNSRNSTTTGTGAASLTVPFLIGATVAALVALYAPITQAGWNPARDFGPRVIAAMAGWGTVAIPGPRNGFWM